MKNHRFLWLRNRTTDNRKCEKARNIKEKRTIEMFNTVSKALAVHRSSQRDNYLSQNKTVGFSVVLLTGKCSWYVTGRRKSLPVIAVFTAFIDSAFLSSVYYRRI